MPLSRQQIIETIRRGGSVLYKNKLISREEQIPGVAAFEMSDEDREAHRRQLQAELDALGARRGAEAKRVKDTDIAENEPFKLSEDEAFKELMKKSREELLNQAKELAAAASVELDLDATKAVLAEFITKTGEIVE